MRGNARPYPWLPDGARTWERPHGGAPGTSPRFVLAFAALVMMRVTTDVPVPWLLAGAAAVAVFSLAAFPLRRRSAGPRGGSWLVLGPRSLSLIAPAGTGAPAVRSDVTASVGRLPGAPESAAALRGAAVLLRAADRGTAGPAAVGAGRAEPDGEETSRTGLFVVHDQRTAFVLHVDEDQAAREPGEEGQRRLLAAAADLLGAPAPELPGRARRVPAEVAVTADDVRAFAHAGLAPAQRLEQEFAGIAVAGPSDVALGLGRLRGWPSRYDGLGVRELLALEPASVAEGLRDDLSAQAALDRAREERGTAGGVTRAWEERWQPYLDSLAARARTVDADAPDVAFTDGLPPGLSGTGRAAELLAVTAAAAAGEPLPGPGADPAVHPLAWPRGRARAAAGDRVLLLLTLAVPLGLSTAWLAGAWG